MSMDVKTSHIVTIIVGFVFVLIGISNILFGTTWWHYLTLIMGLIIVGYAVYGYKTGNRF